jgi:hypothetical protein
LKLFYDENTQFFYLLCSQFRQKASGWINKALLLIKQHITYMNISRYANIDKFVNIRYIFLLARRAYSWLFQLAQMWKLLAPGVGLGDFLTPGLCIKPHWKGKQFLHIVRRFLYRGNRKLTNMDTCSLNRRHTWIVLVYYFPRWVFVSVLHSHLKTSLLQIK